MLVRRPNRPLHVLCHGIPAAIVLASRDRGDKTMAATVKSSVRVFGGILQRMTHQSAVCKCEMTFAVYLPAQSEAAAVHSLYWLSGLTCTDENFAQKAGGFRAAAARGLALVLPDTSPRGVTIEGADDTYDFGSGAGFYVDATEAKWKEHYQMYSYVTKELPAVLAATFPCRAVRVRVRARVRVPVSTR